MGFMATTGSLAKCSFGMAPMPLTFLPTSMTIACGMPVGACTDCIPFLNVPPFALCTSLCNPTTAALTAAALGVLTPGPCIPVPVGMWIPTAPTTMVMTGPVITNSSMLPCAYGGMISISVVPQMVAQTA